MLARGILGSGQTSGVSFRPFPNSSGWWWLIFSVFLIRISCHKTTHANGYYGAWPGWAVSISNNPETSPITIKPKTVSHVVEQSSWVPLLCCSLPRHPFPIKSLALSAHVSPQTIHFSVIDKPTLWPWKESPFLQHYKFQSRVLHYNHSLAHTLLSLYPPAM